MDKAVSIIAIQSTPESTSPHSAATVPKKADYDITRDRAGICRMRKKHTFIRHAIPANQPAVVGPHPYDITASVLHTIDVAYIGNAEFEDTFIIERDALLVGSHPHRTGLIFIKSRYCIVGQSTPVIRIVRQTDFPSRRFYQFNAILIPAYPYTSVFILCHCTYGIVGVRSGRTLFPNLLRKAINPHPLHTEYPRPPTMVDKQIKGSILYFPAIFGNVRIGPLDILLFLIYTNQDTVTQNQQDSFAAFFHVGHFGFRKQFIRPLYCYGIFLFLSIAVNTFTINIDPESLFLINIDKRRISGQTDVPHPGFHITVKNIGSRVVNGIPASRTYPQITGRIFLYILDITIGKRFLVIFLAAINLYIVTIIAVQPRSCTKPHESV